MTKSDDTAHKPWEQTDLFRVLDDKSDRTAEHVKLLLNIWMPEIQMVLANGGAPLTDFTLHDEGHSLRVAKRMVEIIPTDVLPELSAVELGLLLLSAYLHDIGMTPKQQKVTLHYQYLLFGENTKPLEKLPHELTKKEKADFQRWLDDDDEGITPPITDKALTPEDLQKADRLTALYCRHRHNDWSEEWIRKYASDNSTVIANIDPGFIDDLVRLCRSHHEDKAGLEDSTMNPRIIGQPGEVLHLRYLACVLRVADILEFDPERTPDVILRHRAIAAASVIFWHRDKGISRVIKKGNRVVVSARPDTARLHKAIETMFDDIDHELNLCRELADETHFEICPRLAEKSSHRWDLPQKLHRDLEPKANTYEYIDGAFRPNTRKLLELLSGKELYGTALAGVRELL